MHLPSTWVVHAPGTHLGEGGIEVGPGAQPGARLSGRGVNRVLGDQVLAARKLGAKHHQAFAGTADASAVVDRELVAGPGGWGVKEAAEARPHSWRDRGGYTRFILYTFCAQPSPAQPTP